MRATDVLLVAGALVIVGFIGLLVVVLKATARTAENAKEILMALDEIQTKTGALQELNQELNGVETASQRTSTQLRPAAGETNGSGEETEVPS